MLIVTVPGTVILLRNVTEDFNRDHLCFRLGSQYCKIVTFSQIELDI